MTIQGFILSCVTILCVGLVIAFLWGQVGLPTGGADRPWDSAVSLFPSLYAGWVPLIYLFFTSIWMRLAQKDASLAIRFFLKLDCYSYALVLIFFLLQLAWREFDAPALWFRGFVLLLLLLKSLILFRLLYHRLQRLQPVLLFLLGVGLHLLIFPLTYQKLALSLAEVLRPPLLFQLLRIAGKSCCLSLMALEMFRLGVALTKSVQSAFFSWIIVLFTFPALGFPKMSYILAGLLLIFILRLIFSRLNTRELMLGLLTPTNIMILLKLVVILALLLIAGLIFWGNVKPGFEIHSRRALQAAIGTLWDGQFGLLCYTPLYVAALWGIAYLLFFKVWDGVSLVIIGGTLYVGYHLAVYGMLGQSLEQSDIVPFLPILGVFVAIAHERFGKMTLFRGSVRLAAIVTVSITALLLLLYPELPSLPAKLAELQQAVISSLGRDLTYMLPSLAFRPFSMSFLGWLSLTLLFALIFCNNRTRSVSQFTRKAHKALEQYFNLRELSFTPLLLCVFLLLGALLVRSGDVRQPLALGQFRPLSTFQEQGELLFTKPLRGKGLVLVSSLTGSFTIPDQTPVANVIVLGQAQQFESFSLKAGKDTAEETLERQALQNKVLHGKAAIYHSWKVEPEADLSFLAHAYYTKFWFSRPLDVQKVTFKFLGANRADFPAALTLQIKELLLIQ